MKQGITAEQIKEARAKYDLYNTNEWNKNFFDKDTGGYLVTEKARIVQSEKSVNEFKKFDKEQGMCKVLARNGFAVEHLDDMNGSSYDIHLNGIKADLKKTVSHNNMVHYAKKATNEQGAEMVVFEFDAMTGKIHEELNKLKRIGINVLYFTSENKNIIRTP